MGLGQAHRFFIFDRHFACRLDYKWPSTSKTSTSPAAETKEMKDGSLSDTETMQLIMGLTFSLKNMMLRLAPEVPAGSESGPASASSSRRSSKVSSPTTTIKAEDGPVWTRKEVCFSYITSKYRLCYFESVSGWKLVLLSDPSAASSTAEVEQVMRSLYDEVLVRQVMHSPIFRLTEASFDRPNVISRLEALLHTSA